MRKNRIAAGAAVLLVAAGSVTACSSSPAAEDDQSLLMWVDVTREPAARAYAASVEGDVDVKIEVVDDIIAKAALVMQTNEGMPDLVWSSGANGVVQLASTGFAAPLDDLLSADTVEGYGTANAWCEVDGVTYCLRNDLAQTVLWYDTQVFAELGLEVPETMEEFSETALAMAGTGYVAGALGASALYYGFLQTSGCPLADTQGDMVVRIEPDAPECARALELVQPLLDAGVIDKRSPFDAAFIAEVAQAGKVAMFIGPSWWGDFVMKPAESWAIPEGRIAAAPTPTWDDTPVAGAYGGGMWIVSSKSKNLELATSAAEWLVTSPEVQTDAPTFPAFGPANVAWGERVSGDTYYAEDPVPVLQAAAQTISSLDDAVLYELAESEGSVLQPAIESGEPLDVAFAKFGDHVIESAKAVGYDVRRD